MDILAHTATAVTLRVGRCRGAAWPVRDHDIGGALVPP